jgi:hypothetical protein
MYDWTKEKRDLRDKTVEDQRTIFAKWVKGIVWQVGCTCREAEKFPTAGLADLLRPGYETFEHPRFERGTCCELLNCQKRVQPAATK